jgi:hypothetical protein
MDLAITLLRLRPMSGGDGPSALAVGVLTKGLRADRPPFVSPRPRLTLCKRASIAVSNNFHGKGAPLS